MRAEMSVVSPDQHATGAIEFALPLEHFYNREISEANTLRSFIWKVRYPHCNVTGSGKWSGCERNISGYSQADLLGKALGCLTSKSAV